MTSEERVKFALQHQEPDRIPLDFGATLLTGIHISAYKNLLTYLDIEKSEFPLMFERPQDVMIHDDVLDRFGVDVQGLIPHEPPRIRSEDNEYDYYIAVYETLEEWGKY